MIYHFLNLIGGRLLKPFDYATGRKTTLGEIKIGYKLVISNDFIINNGNRLNTSKRHY